jgi:hypothetical protein
LAEYVGERGGGERRAVMHPVSQCTSLILLLYAVVVVVVLLFLCTLLPLLLLQ